jgi:hypothetical protein
VKGEGQGYHFQEMSLSKLAPQNCAVYRGVLCVLLESVRSAGRAVFGRWKLHMRHPTSKLTHITPGGDGSQPPWANLYLQSPREEDVLASTIIAFTVVISMIRMSQFFSTLQ